MVTKKRKSDDDSKMWAFLGVFLTVIGFIIVFFIKKDDEYSMYYAKLGLVLFIAWVVIVLLEKIPIVGWVIYVVCGILLLIVWVMAFIAAFSGEKKRFIVLSDIADKIKI